MNIALIPAYEPGEKLIKLVADLKASLFEVIVVNDGSDPSFDKIFDLLDCQVLGYAVNEGKGYALKYGLRYIKSNYHDYVVVTMDSDGQHTVSDALKLCECAQKEDALFLGKRDFSLNVPLRSRLGNLITRKVYYYTTKVNIYDTQTGLRAFTSSLVSFLLEIPGNRFEYEMNVLLMFPKKNIPIKEVPIKTIYFDNNKGSHFKTVRDSYLIYKEILRFSCCSFGSFLIDYGLYILLMALFHNLLLANLLARVVSASINYNLNKRVVFQSEKKSFWQYFLLALGILILNTLILNGLVSIGINAYLAKLMTEIFLFVISFTVQKLVIFKKD